MSLCARSIKPLEGDPIGFFVRQAFPVPLILARTVSAATADQVTSADTCLNRSVRLRLESLPPLIGFGLIGVDIGIARLMQLS